MGRPKKTKYPIAWHEDCLRNMKTSAEQLHSKIIWYTAAESRMNRQIKEYEEAIEKAKEKGLTEFPAID